MILFILKADNVNQAVKRSIEKFPKEFMLQMTREELENWKSQITIFNKVKVEWHSGKQIH